MLLALAIKFKLLNREPCLLRSVSSSVAYSRLELMSMINSVLREGFDWRGIDIIFTRNIPI